MKEVKTTICHLVDYSCPNCLSSRTCLHTSKHAIFVFPSPIVKQEKPTKRLISQYTGKEGLFYSNHSSFMHIVLNQKFCKENESLHYDHILVHLTNTIQFTRNGIKFSSFYVYHLVV